MRYEDQFEVDDYDGQVAGDDSDRMYEDEYSASSQFDQAGKFYDYAYQFAGDFGPEENSYAHSVVEYPEDQTVSIGSAYEDEPVVEASHNSYSEDSLVLSAQQLGAPSRSRILNYDIVKDVSSIGEKSSPSFIPFPTAFYPNHRPIVGDSGSSVNTMGRKGRTVDFGSSKDDFVPVISEPARVFKSAVGSHSPRLHSVVSKVGSHYPHLHSVISKAGSHSPHLHSVTKVDSRSPFLHTVGTHNPYLHSAPLKVVSHNTPFRHVVGVSHVDDHMPYFHAVEATKPVYRPLYQTVQPVAHHRASYGFGHSPRYPWGDRLYDARSLLHTKPAFSLISH